MRCGGLRITLNRRHALPTNLQHGVAKGSCVLLLDDEIVYAGPLKGAPDVTGKMVLLNPDDFERLKAHVDRGRH